MDRLEQDLIKELSNAIKQGPGGGDIVVNALRGGEQAVVSIADQGSGSGAEDLPLHFQPFSRPSSQEGPGGAGSGLSISGGIMRARGGRMWARSSEVCNGSTLTVTPPASSAWPAPEPAPCLGAPAARPPRSLAIAPARRTRRRRRQRQRRALPGHRGAWPGVDPGLGPQSGRRLCMNW